jgi:predicted component of type VI protein secretion system
VPQLRNLLEFREAMKALRPKMGEKAIQNELLKAIKDPATRDGILKMIASPSGQTPSPASPGQGS